MLNQNDIKLWFQSNGLDIGLPFPKFLMSRIIKKALEKDRHIFTMLSRSFCPYKNNDNLLTLNFNNWNEVFICYSSVYCAALSTSIG